MAKCNIDAIAGAGILSRFPGSLTESEEDQVAEKFSALCFYETWGTRNYRECSCTRCKQPFGLYKDEARDFFKVHHNDFTYCPQCGAPVQLKSLGRVRQLHNLDETVSAVFVRTDREGALTHSAGLATRKIWDRCDLTPEIHWREKARYYLAPGRVIGWKRSINGYIVALLGPQPWEQMKNIRKPFRNDPSHGHTDEYWLFGTEALEQSQFRYCQIHTWYQALMGRELWDPDSGARMCIEYLAEYALHPQMELAVKMGMHGAVTDLCNGRQNYRDLDWRADKPWAFLRLSKPDAKAFLACPSLGLLRWIHREQRAGTGMPVRDLIQLWQSFGGTKAEKLASCALRCGVSAQRAERYVSSWQAGSKGLGAELWYDYLDMAQKLGYDLSRPDVRMPKDLRARHDAAAQTLQLEEDEKQARAYAKRLKLLREKYEFQLDGLRILVPENARQIVEEGRTLRHCVGKDAARHIQGKATILFLRRAKRPERSYVTIEMCGANGADIQQIHGFRNEDYRGSVSPSRRYEHFLAVWQGWMKAGSKRDKDGKPVLPGQKEGAA